MSLLKKFTTIKTISEFLRNIDSAYSLSSKEKYVERLKIFQKVLDFPWREDQLNVLNDVIQDKNKYYVINGIFGCGKTTLLFGILINLIINELYKPTEVMFISFNVCIRNELRQKLKPYGFKGKIKVSTFDSIIYFICKHFEYPHLDLPNFDGKRRFCQELCENGKAEPVTFQPKIIFIDEVQDLERNTFNIFEQFYPNSKIVFAGDVFQSIQKEPRDSLLWFLLNQQTLDLSKFYMNITPRVPRGILSNLKKTLTTYYPEFTKEIAGWKSTNDNSDAKVEWSRFYSYGQIFDIAKKKIEEYGEKNTMILTFSSAITVKGAMGDIARLRRNFLAENIELNKNHKKLDYDKLFLSTANSSKGLERDHVVVFLTFPLEKAFSSFSDDIVVNLITVAITRAMKTVHFFVPAYEDKFTRVLTFFDKCPQPNKEKIREGKNLNDFNFQDFLQIERCTTEMIRQSIIFYDTRIKIKEYIKQYESEKLFDGDVKAKRPAAFCEEERAMVGVIIENLMTSTWTNKWPDVEDISRLKNHPMYLHIFKKIENISARYKDYKKNKSMDNVNQFKGIYIFSQLHLAIYNKLFITFTQENINILENYWRSLKPKIISIKPPSKKLQVQVNLQMPFLTGIADAIFINEDDEVNIWEIKASVEMDWKDNALTQAFLYALMTGKSWSRITLINPFRNERVNYYFKSNLIMSLRNLVYQDIITWNYNCWLAKNYNRLNPRVLKVNNCYCAHLSYLKSKCWKCKKEEILHTINPCEHRFCKECLKEHDNCPDCEVEIKSVQKNYPCQLTIIEFLTPTKSFVRVNDFYKISYKTERKVCCKREKLCLESEKTFDYEWREKLKKPTWLVNDNFHDLIPKVTDWKKELDYEKNEDLNYQLDFNDSLIILYCYLHNLAKNYKFI